MKYLPKILLLLSIAGIVSCSKKNDSSKSSASIVGKWAFVTDTTRYYSGGTLQETDANLSISPGDYIQFNSDGSGVAVQAAGSSAFTYKLSGNKLSVTTAATTSNNVQIPSTTLVATIKTLTSTDLYLYFDDTETDNNVSYELTEAEHFKKQ